MRITVHPPLLKSCTQHVTRGPTFQPWSLTMSTEPASVYFDPGSEHSHWQTSGLSKHAVWTVRCNTVPLRDVHG